MFLRFFFSKYVQGVIWGPLLGRMFSAFLLPGMRVQDEIKTCQILHPEANIKENEPNILIRGDEHIEKDGKHKKHIKQCMFIGSSFLIFEVWMNWMKELSMLDLRFGFYVKNYPYGQFPRSKIAHPGQI